MLISVGLKLSRFLFSRVLMVALIGGTILSSSNIGFSQAGGELIYGMTVEALSGTATGSNGVSLISFNSATPGTVTTVGPFTGLVSGQRIRSIDFRPANGQLYGLGTDATGSTAQIYTINLTTAVCTPVGAGFTLGTNGFTFVEMDFNPVVDRIRIISAGGGTVGNNNFRANPNDGTLVAQDTALAFDASSPRSGMTNFNIIGAAYSNNVVGATQTTLYAWDFNNDALLTIGGPNGTPSPNGGLMFTVSTPATFLTFSPVFGMDISGITSTLYVAHDDAATGTSSNLYTRNVMTGAQTLIGAYPANTFVGDISVFIQAGVPTPTGTPSGSPTGTASGTPTLTATGTPLGSPTGTASGTPTLTATGTPAGSPTGTASGTPTGTPSGSPTGTASGTPTGTPSGSPSATASPTGSPTGSVFANTAAFCTTLGTQADIYPSNINVVGGPVQIDGLRVTLVDVTQNLPDNMDFLLVGPNGAKFILLADAGGAIPVSSPGVTLTIADAAGVVVPDSGPLTTGTFEPTSWEPGQTSFPPPAPPAPYNEPGSAVGGTGTQTLGGNFRFSNSNGVWSLYLRDDGGTFTRPASGVFGRPSAVSGCVNGGWRLEFIPTTAGDVNLSGRVQTADGQGIRNAKVVITGNSLNEPVVTTTGSFGYFSFGGLQTGETYVVTVISKRYTFSAPSRVINLVDNVVDADFVADPQQ